MGYEHRTANGPTGARRWRALAIIFGLVATPAASAASDADLEGIWKGMLVAKEAEVEAEILFEIGRAPEGDLTGTFDMPVQDFLFHPLEQIAFDGSKVVFDFRRDSEHRGRNARYVLEGELSEDRRRIEGNVVDGERRIPFHLAWTAEAGTPREERRVPEVAQLSDRGEELRAAFNREQDHVRLVLTLSPT